jgi:rhodanese-related sulfurtransferase
VLQLQFDITKVISVNISTISATEFADLCRDRRDVEVIDVRTRAEYRDVRLAIAQTVPLHRLDPTSLMGARNGPGETLCVLCQSGARGRQACDKYHKAGFTNVVDVAGTDQSELLRTLRTGSRNMDQPLATGHETARLNKRYFSSTLHCSLTPHNKKE